MRADFSMEKDHASSTFRETLIWASKHKRVDLLRLMFKGLDEILKCLLVAMSNNISRLDEWISTIFDPIPIIKDVQMMYSTMETSCLTLCETLSRCGSCT